MIEKLHITALGARGDGVAAAAGESVHVPFTLPGEQVLAERQGRKARLVEVLEASPERAMPACRHFGACGGCNLQHLAGQAYGQWKAQRVFSELEARGLSFGRGELVACPPRTRRRATFTVANVEGKPAIGYHAAASHRLVAIEECPVLLPEIVAKLPALRELGRLAGGGARPVRLAITHTAAGLDVAISEARPADEQRRQSLIRAALACGLARLSLAGEILVQARPPQVAAGRAVLMPPVGGFLQATSLAEEKMAELVAEHLGPCRHVADLFAGSGSFALRLAQVATIHAVESDGAALAALERAFRAAPGLKRITTERRDLERRPLTASELNRFDGLVFDPPRAGAADQAMQIARSKVSRVAAVSCNPATLARDLSLLVEGGYRIVSVTPIDQFLWSAHVEAVALAVKS